MAGKKGALGRKEKKRDLAVSLTGYQRGPKALNLMFNRAW